jgi:hypothetical protein
MTWLKSWARPRSILIFLGVVIACQIGFLVLFQALAAQGVPTTLDMMTGFSPAQARAHFMLYNDQARVILNWFQAVDVVFPVGYGLFFAGFITWLLMKLMPAARRLLLLGLVPVTGAVFDLLENTGIFIMVRIYPADINTAAVLTSAAGVVKNLLFIGSLLFMVVLTVVYIVRRISTKGQPPTG